MQLGQEPHAQRAPGWVQGLAWAPVSCCREIRVTTDASESAVRETLKQKHRPTSPRTAACWRGRRIRRGKVLWARGAPPGRAAQGVGQLCRGRPLGSKHRPECGRPGGQAGVGGGAGAANRSPPLSPPVGEACGRAELRHGSMTAPESAAPRRRRDEGAPEQRPLPARSA